MALSVLSLYLRLYNTHISIHNCTSPFFRAILSVALEMRSHPGKFPAISQSRYIFVSGSRLDETIECGCQGGSASLTLSISAIVLSIHKCAGCEPQAINLTGMVLQPQTVAD